MVIVHTNASISLTLLAQKGSCVIGRNSEIFLETCARELCDAALCLIGMRCPELEITAHRTKRMSIKIISVYHVIQKER